MLTAVGTGVYKTIVEACDPTIKVTDSWKLYDAAYPLYAQLYRSLKGDYAAIAKFVASHR